jgi:hypothetical protein
VKSLDDDAPPPPARDTICSGVLAPGLVLAVAHFALSATIFFWGLDEAIDLQKRSLPPPEPHFLVRAFMAATHPVTIAVGKLFESVRDDVRPLMLFATFIAESLLWGFACAFAVVWIKRFLSPARPAPP